MSHKTALKILAVTIGMILSHVSFAGERGGNGEWTAIDWNPKTMAAICAYSGLEDQDHGGPVPDVVPGDTQTPHEENGFDLPPGVAQICQYLNNGRNPKQPPPPPPED